MTAVDDAVAIADWLNRHLGADTPQMSMQILKVVSEVGEAADAWNSHIGDPWKPVVSFDDVLDELADVAISAMVAIARLGGNPTVVVGAKAARVRARCEALPGPRPDRVAAGEIEGAE